MGKFRKPSAADWATCLLPIITADFNDGASLASCLLLLSRHACCPLMQLSWWCALQVHVPDNDGTHDTEAGEYADSHVSHTGQVFFPEDIYSQIATLEPYTSDEHTRVHLEDDHDYHDDPTAVLPLTQLDAQDIQKGFAASVTIIVDPASTPAPIRPGLWKKATSALPSWMRF